MLSRIANTLLGGVLVKVSVVFPNVIYRDGPEGVNRFIRGVESLGFDELDMFDHVLMGYPTESRKAPFYPSQMPLMEALMVLSYAAAITERIGLGTGVLVLPQRQPALVARQVATLDTLTGGRVRLGLGVGWQASEYEALGENFRNRGRRFDEGVRLLRAYWGEEQVDFEGEYYRAEAMAFEPKPPQGAGIPVWIGGAVPRTLERVAEYGDGWMGQFVKSPEVATRLMQKIRDGAEAAGRDPKQIGMQLSLSPFMEEKGKGFFRDTPRIADRYAELASLGFNWTSIDTVPLFQAGARSVEALLEKLAEIRQAIDSHSTG
jgi:probable F420-dependent oxidoreductase